MEAVNGVLDGGPPPPSPLTGCYLLIVIGEPHSQEHKDIILQRVAKGLLSWDVNDCLIDLEKELAVITEQAPEGEEARYGERLIQYASENLVTEVLIHPAVSTLAQCVRNLLSSFTRHRHIIHAGYTFAANGSWILQDGTFSLIDFSEAFQEIEVQRVIRAYENSISVDIHCSPEGDWTRLPKESFAKNCKVRVNPVDVLNSGSPSITNFLNYVSPFVTPTDIETLLESSDVVGNIRFSHPTLYIFPGGQGDAALFGINGFNMLLDGGFSRKACFWDFVRHLDRLDAVLLTRLNNGNVSGISSVLRRKMQNALYPQIGHFFCNIQERKAILSPDGDKDKDPLLIDLLQEGQEIITNLRKLTLTPQTCYRDTEPINLYHKVGHGTLDMYVLSPAKESKEVKDFLHKWNTNDQKLFSNQKNSKDFMFPVPNLVSICALLIWQPANPNDNITRILYPGSTPQQKIFEGLDKLKNLDYIKYPVCSEKKLISSSSIIPLKSKQMKDNALEKLIQSEQKAQKIQSAENKLKEKPPKSKTENKFIEANDKTDAINGLAVDTDSTDKSVKKSDSTDSEKSIRSTKVKKSEDKILANGKPEEKQKPKAEPKPKEEKPKSDAKPAVTKNKIEHKAADKKKSIAEKKASPTTPKKTIESRINGDARDLVKPRVAKVSPSATPAKSTKDANNRKVVESKHRLAPKKEPAKVPEKKEAKPERKPISRRPKGTSPTTKTVGSPVKKVNGTQKPDSIIRKGKLDKEGTTDSSTVSTPSADQKDISKLTHEELEQLKAQELADLKEEQEVVKEIEAVFRKGETQTDNESELRKIKDLSIEDKTEPEEYLIIEKEEIEHDSLDEKDTKEAETQKLTRDSEESEKLKKLSDDEKLPFDETEKGDDVKKMEVSTAELQSETDIAKAKEDKEKQVETSKEMSVTSPEDKLDVSSEKKIGDVDAQEPNVALESQPDEKISATIESGATTTAPTLPEDERITLDEIKEDNGDQVIEEKHVKEDTKEKDLPVIQLPAKTFEPLSKLPPVVGIRLDKQSHIRDIVKTPDEVADLPVHEEVDIEHYQYQMDEIKRGLKPEDAKIETKAEVKTEVLQKPDDAKGDDRIAKKPEETEPEPKTEALALEIKTEKKIGVTDKSKVDEEMQAIREAVAETAKDADEVEVAEEIAQPDLKEEIVEKVGVGEVPKQALAPKDKVGEILTEQKDEKVEETADLHMEETNVRHVTTETVVIDAKPVTETTVASQEIDLKPKEEVTGHVEREVIEDQKADDIKEDKKGEVETDKEERFAEVPSAEAESEDKIIKEEEHVEKGGTKLVGQEILPQDSRKTEEEIINNEEQAPGKEEKEETQEIKIAKVSLEKELVLEAKLSVEVEKDDSEASTEKDVVTTESIKMEREDKISEEDEKQTVAKGKTEKQPEVEDVAESKPDDKDRKIAADLADEPTKDVKDVTKPDEREVKTEETEVIENIPDEEIKSDVTIKAAETEEKPFPQKGEKTVGDGVMVKKPEDQVKVDDIGTLEKEIFENKDKSIPHDIEEKSDKSKEVEIRTEPKVDINQEVFKETVTDKEAVKDEKVDISPKLEEKVDVQQKVEALEEAATEIKKAVHVELEEKVGEAKEAASEPEEKEIAKTKVFLTEATKELSQSDKVQETSEEKTDGVEVPTKTSDEIIELKKEVNEQELTKAKDALSDETVLKESTEIDNKITEEQERGEKKTEAVSADEVPEADKAVLEKVETKVEKDVTETEKDEKIEESKKELVPQQRVDDQFVEKDIIKEEDRVPAGEDKVDVQLEVDKVKTAKDVGVAKAEDQKIIDEDKTSKQDLDSTDNKLKLEGESTKDKIVDEEIKHTETSTKSETEKVVDKTVDNKISESLKISIEEAKKSKAQPSVGADKKKMQEEEIKTDVCEVILRDKEKAQVTKDENEVVNPDIKETTAVEEDVGVEEEVDEEKDWQSEKDIKGSSDEVKHDAGDKIKGDTKVGKPELHVTKEYDEREKAYEEVLVGKKLVDELNKGDVIVGDKAPTTKGDKDLQVETKTDALNAQDLEREMEESMKEETNVQDLKREMEESLKEETKVQDLKQEVIEFLSAETKIQETKGEDLNREVEESLKESTKIAEAKVEDLEQEMEQAVREEAKLAETKFKDMKREVEEDLKTEAKLTETECQDFTQQIDEQETQPQHLKQEIEESLKREDLSLKEYELHAIKHVVEDITGKSISQAESTESSTDQGLQTYKEPDVIDKMEIGRKSPKEREEDVAIIVASVAEVLKSDAPLEEFEGKIPLTIAPFAPFVTSYTTELRETHITTVDSPLTEQPPVTDVRPDAPKPHDESVEEPDKSESTKITDLIRDSNVLMEATSKIISDIKIAQAEEARSESDAGTVHRMLVTTSSEDGGEEIEICPTGTIIFSKSSESSGRSSPELKLSQKSVIDIQDVSQDSKVSSGKSTPDIRTLETEKGETEKAEKALEKDDDKHEADVVSAEQIQSTKPLKDAEKQPLELSAETFPTDRKEPLSAASSAGLVAIADEAELKGVLKPVTVASEKSTQNLKEPISFDRASPEIKEQLTSPGKLSGRSTPETKSAESGKSTPELKVLDVSKTEKGTVSGEAISEIKEIVQSDDPEQVQEEIKEKVELKESVKSTSEQKQVIVPTPDSISSDRILPETREHLAAPDKSSGRSTPDTKSVDSGRATPETKDSEVSKSPTGKLTEMEKVTDKSRSELKEFTQTGKPEQVEEQVEKLELNEQIKTLPKQKEKAEELLIAAISEPIATDRASPEIKEHISAPDRLSGRSTPDTKSVDSGRSTPEMKDSVISKSPTDKPAENEIISEIKESNQSGESKFETPEPKLLQGQKQESAKEPLAAQATELKESTSSTKTETAYKTEQVESIEFVAAKSEILGERRSTPSPTIDTEESSKGRLSPLEKQEIVSQDMRNSPDKSTSEEKELVIQKAELEEKSDVSEQDVKAEPTELVLPEIKGETSPEQMNGLVGPPESTASGKSSLDLKYSVSSKDETASLPSLKDEFVSQKEESSVTKTEVKEKTDSIENPAVDVEPKQIAYGTEIAQKTAVFESKQEAIRQSSVAETKDGTVSDTTSTIEPESEDLVLEAQEATSHEVKPAEVETVKVATFEVADNAGTATITKEIEAKIEISKDEVKGERKLSKDLQEIPTKVSDATGKIDEAIPSQDSGKIMVDTDEEKKIEHKTDKTHSAILTQEIEEKLAVEQEVKVPEPKVLQELEGKITDTSTIAPAILGQSEDKKPEQILTDDPKSVQVETAVISSDTDSAKIDAKVSTASEVYDYEAEKHEKKAPVGKILEAVTSTKSEVTASDETKSILEDKTETESDYNKIKDTLSGDSVDSTVVTMAISKEKQEEDAGDKCETKSSVVHTDDTKHVEEEAITTITPDIPTLITDTKLEEATSDEDVAKTDARKVDVLTHESKQETQKQAEIVGEDSKQSDENEIPPSYASCKLSSDSETTESITIKKNSEEKFPSKYKEEKTVDDDGSNISKSETEGVSQEVDCSHSEGKELRKESKSEPYMLDDKILIKKEADVKPAEKDLHKDVDTVGQTPLEKDDLKEGSDDKEKVPKEESRSATKEEPQTREEGLDLDAIIKSEEETLIQGDMKELKKDQEDNIVTPDLQAKSDVVVLSTAIDVSAKELNKIEPDSIKTEKLSEKLASETKTDDKEVEAKDEVLHTIEESPTSAPLISDDPETTSDASKEPKDAVAKDKELCTKELSTESFISAPLKTLHRESKSDSPEKPKDTETIDEDLTTKEPHAESSSVVPAKLDSPKTQTDGSEKPKYVEIKYEDLHTKETSAESSSWAPSKPDSPEIKTVYSEKPKDAEIKDEDRHTKESSVEGFSSAPSKTASLETRTVGSEKPKDGETKDEAPHMKESSVESSSSVPSKTDGADTKTVDSTKPEAVQTIDEDLHTAPLKTDRLKTKADGSDIKCDGFEEPKCVPVESDNKSEGRDEKSKAEDAIIDISTSKITAQEDSKDVTQSSVILKSSVPETQEKLEETETASGKTVPETDSAEKSSDACAVQRVDQDKSTEKGTKEQVDLKTDDSVTEKTASDIVLSQDKFVDSGDKLADEKTEQQKKDIVEASDVKAVSDAAQPSDIRPSAEDVVSKERGQESSICDKKVSESIIDTPEDSVAGPSKTDTLSLSPSKPTYEESDLSGKSTPDIADVEKQKEMQETLKFEKHIPGCSTPPTVPVSPIVKDVVPTLQDDAKPPATEATASDTKADKKVIETTSIATIKEQDIRSSTPGSDDYEYGGVSSTHSDISSGQMSRAPNLLEGDRHESDEDDILGSPLSVTSQIGHSPSSHYEFEDDKKVSKSDQMNVSFYGTLPGDAPEAARFKSARFLDDSDLDFEKALQEHREARGEDLTADRDSPSHLYEITAAKYSARGIDEARRCDSIPLEHVGANSKKTEPDLMTSSFIGTELPGETRIQEKDKTKDPIESWGKPLGLPSPAPPNDNKGTPKKERKLPPNVTAKNKLNDDKKRSESPSKYDKKQKKITPVYVDLTYVPHHGNSNYSYLEFFKRVRARYYVFSGIEPSKEVYNALLEAKQTWEDKELEVTIIPTYDTDVLGYWVAENEDLLTKCKIDLSPSASRCTINLQDHETSCSAYRLEF